MNEILTRRRDGGLFRYLLEKFASYSGISGVQPKILVRDEQSFAQMQNGPRLSQSYRGATHIVKLWEPNEYPQLAANEHSASASPRDADLKCRPTGLRKTAWPSS